MHVRKYVLYVPHLPACPSFPFIQLKALWGLSGQGMLGRPADGILVCRGVVLGCVVVAWRSCSHLIAVVTTSVVHYTVLVIQHWKTTRKSTSLTNRIAYSDRNSAQQYFTS